MLRAQSPCKARSIEPSFAVQDEPIPLTPYRQFADNLCVTAFHHPKIPDRRSIWTKTWILDCGSFVTCTRPGEVTGSTHAASGGIL
jgi:hypothetical protein